MKKYKCGLFVYTLPDHCCVFCKHCSAVWWDYSNGICNITCDNDIYGINGNIQNVCDKFEDDL